MFRVVFLGEGKKYLVEVGFLILLDFKSSFFFFYFFSTSFLFLFDVIFFSFSHFFSLYFSRNCSLYFFSIFLKTNDDWKKDRK